MKTARALAAAFAVVILAGCQRAGDGPRQAPLASAESLPDWARTGRYRSVRWDGGPIEAEKGRLSGWPDYTLQDEKGVMAATRDWYHPRTVEFLKTGRFNWAWVTWSVGFSHETERPQWEQLRRYVEECHRNGIHVTAYMSNANMFWQEMFENVPASRNWVERMPDGSPRFYSFPHRYMADITRPEWIDYVKVRVRAAMDAGVDGFWIDNTFSYHGEDNVRRFLDQIHAEASRAGRKIVLLSNYNRAVYTWARWQNGVTTEDGQEPGYYPEEPENKRLVTNAGLLRYQYGVSEGWRPVSAEYGGRHAGNRFTTPMEPRKWQLSLAECAAFQASLEPFFEGMFLRDLYFGEAKALANLKAIGEYNAFFETNAEYYADVEPAAAIAVLADATDRAVALLNQLSALDLQYEVLFNYQEPGLERLKRYKAILLPHTNPVSNGLCRRLGEYVKGGGAVAAIQDASAFAEKGENRDDLGLAEALGISLKRLPGQKTAGTYGAGKTDYYPAPVEARELAGELRRLAGDEQALVTAPGVVLHNTVRQPSRRRLIVHLLNYEQKPLGGIRIRVRGPVASALVLSPEWAGGRAAALKVEGKFTTVEVPLVGTYSLVAITMGGEVSR